MILETELKIGLTGDYGFFKNVSINAIMDKTIIMVDKNGNCKEVFKGLFLKYFIPISDNISCTKGVLR